MYVAAALCNACSANNGKETRDARSGREPVYSVPPNRFLLRSMLARGAPYKANAHTYVCSFARLMHVF